MMSRRLTAVISIKMGSKGFLFEGQTKGKLRHSEVQQLLTNCRDELEVYFEEHPDIATTIVGKSVFSLSKSARLLAPPKTHHALRCPSNLLFFPEN
jgi:DNA gyrase/topoisomerase IV subunit B